MFIWVALKENARLARVLWIITNACSNQGFLLGQWKIYQKQKATEKPDAETISSWSCDMEGHAKKGVERYCELANKATQQFFKVATRCMDDHLFKEQETGSVGELSTVCSTNCSEMSVFGSYWETWYLVVCEQTCSCGNEMDKSLWQTLGALDLLHSSYKWVQTILSCGKYC